MAGILMLLCFLACGTVTALSVFRHISLVARVWIGLCLGLVLMMWLPALYAFVFSFNAMVQWLALGTAAIIAVVCALTLRKKPLLNRSLSDDLPVWVLVALVLPFTILSAYLQYTHTIRPIDGALHVGQSTYGDLCLHLGFATSFQNASFPPDYSILRGTLVGYPFLSDSMVTTMLLMGTDLAQSFIVTGTLMMFLVYVGFVLFAWELTRSKVAVICSFLLLFLNGGLGFIYVLDGVFKDSSMLREVFTGFYRAPANLIEYNVRWVNVICDMMIPQRTLLAGWMTLLPALYQLALAVRYRLKSAFLWLGIWAGAMPMIHTHSFLALGLISLGAMIVCCIGDLVQKKKSLLLPFLLYGCVAALLALPQLMTWTFPQTVGGHSLGLRFNWVNNQGNGQLIDEYFWFWIKNVGPVYVMLVPAVLMCKKGSIHRALGLGALIVYAVAECIQFQPNPYDNNKLFYAAFIAVLPMVGMYLERLWKALSGLRIRGALAVLLAVTCTLSGGLSVAREVVSDYQLFGENEVKAAQFVIQNTPEHAQFLTGQQHNNAIAALTGRYILCGTGSYLYYHGVGYASQQRDMQLLYEAPGENEELFTQYGIEYVYISGHEKSSFDIDTTYFEERFDAIYDADGITIYQITA